MVKLDNTEVAERAGEFVQEIVRECGLELDVVGSSDENTIRVDLCGIDSDLVLADSAELLYALNHLVNQVFFRMVRENCDFVVDCENYRTDRTVELELIAQKAAERVRSSGRSVILQPMPSTERRIIHLALAAERGVRTVSEGNGRFRRVQILPA